MFASRPEIALASLTFVALISSGCGGAQLAGGTCPDGSQPTPGAPPLALEAPADASSVVTGALGDGVPSAEGRPFQAYRLALAAGERVRVELDAGFDTYLIVRPPQGEPMENDDRAEGDLNSRVDFTASRAGEYVIDASAYEPSARGGYRLVVMRGRGVPAPPPPTGSPIAPGVVTNGMLSMGDHLVEGKIVDDFQFQGHRGDLVTIDLASPAFDTYLTVRSPDGQTFVSDDISGANLNSRVQATLSMDGAYAIEVSSYSQGALGAYTLQLDRSPRPVRTPGATLVTDVTGANGHGRVFGLFVGIRDYGGESGDLPNCDTDATELARVFRDRGVQTSAQQIVLTNAQATGDAVHAALTALSSQVGEDDMLFFFYSGHGGQHAGAVSATEPDGLDETIHLRGGPVTDDDFTAWLAPIRGSIVVALDSCYSGGFARDVVSAPRRVGIFASEEDTLSDVASRYQAGGFLSYWLKLGIDGAADGNGDGTLRVGELVDYLYGQFGEHRREMATTSNGGGETFQHLVVARGSVVSTELLLRYPD